LLFKNGTSAPIILTGEQDVSDWSYFTRDGIKQFMVFTSRTVFNQVHNLKATVKEKEYFCHCIKAKDGFGAVLIADAEYKNSLAFILISDLLNKFRRKFSARADFKARCTKDHGFDADFPELAKLLVDAQDPMKVDKVAKIQATLDQTKAVMYDTIDSLLDRGVKLDDLVEKSDDLTDRSKKFYEAAKSTNSCCIMS